MATPPGRDFTCFCVASREVRAEFAQCCRRIDPGRSPRSLLSSAAASEELMEMADLGRPIGSAKKGPSFKSGRQRLRCHSQ
jgi:hypothetical protein